MFISANTLNFIFEITIINTLKFLLEESEKIFLFNFLPNSVLGDFSFVTNAMGLIVNNVLAPIEQFFQNYFSKQYAAIQCENKEENKLTIYSDTFQVFGTILRYLNIFCQLCILYGFYMLNKETMYPLFGQNYARNDIIYGFMLYFILLLPMAINGITEALLYSIVSTTNYKKLRVYNIILGG